MNVNKIQSYIQYVKEMSDEEREELLHRYLLRNPDMLARWIAMALIETETRLRRIPNYKKLHLLRKAIKAKLKLNQSKVA